VSQGPSAKPVTIPADVYAKLETLMHSTSAPHAVVVRARIVLLSGRGLGTAAVARLVGCSDRAVRKWRARFREDPVVEALNDGRRSGRPAQVPLTVRCRVIQLACDRPKDSHAPFRDVWTWSSLAKAVEVDTGFRLSQSEVGRILHYEGLRPHRVRQWLHSPDPNFALKADEVCALYLNPPDGAVVVCVDEKPIQVLSRKYPTQRAPDGSVRYEYEYARHGTCALLGAFDVQTGKVVADVVPRRTADATVEFMDRVAATYPDQTVYVVWDNLNTHYDGPSQRWTRFNEAHGGRFRFVYTPIHASWLNQIEIWFSIIERRLLRRGSFESYSALHDRLLGFVQHWNTSEAHPFRWTWRRPESDNRLRRVA